MAKQAYRLQPVLEKRVRERDKAQSLVAEAKLAVTYEEKKLEKLCEMRMEVDRRKQACTDNFYRMIGEPGVDIGAQSTAHDRYQEVLKREAKHHDEAIVRQKIAIEDAKERVKIREKELLQASINVQAMEKHKEEWQLQVKREEIEKEQEQQEELGEAMWLQARRNAARPE